MGKSFIKVFFLYNKYLPVVNSYYILTKSYYLIENDLGSMKENVVFVFRYFLEYFSYL